MGNLSGLDTIQALQEFLIDSVNPPLDYVLTFTSAWSKEMLTNVSSPMNIKLCFPRLVAKSKTDLCKGHDTVFWRCVDHVSLDKKCCKNIGSITSPCVRDAQRMSLETLISPNYTIWDHPRGESRFKSMVPDVLSGLCQPRQIQYYLQILQLIPNTI